MLVAKGDPQPTSHVMIATPLIIYIASRSRPGPADGDHGQSDDGAGGLTGSDSYFILFFPLATILLRDASLRSRIFLATRRSALLDSRSFHDVVGFEGLPGLVSDSDDEAEEEIAERARLGQGSEAQGSKGSVHSFYSPLI